jgi:two-component system, chemotaxis family, CheB/CheR fusion protein
VAPQGPSLVVGIGASAGGLEALEGLFRSMPADTGLTFILVTHMARGTPSSLPDIIARFAPLPVTTAVDGGAIEPNHVYVCPSDHILTLGDNRLHLHSRVSEAQHKPIDVFLSSLADERGEAAIGILLSGGGSDGTLGIKAIKERGGLTLAQGADGTGPIQASMPDTAIAAGVVDIVLPVDQMALRLAEYARNFQASRVDGEADDDSFNGADVRDPICRILLNQVGHDFSGYKEKTFMRRVRRRMQVLQIEQVERYVERLREEPDEVSMLFRDLLIGVTNFFRDPDAFDALEKQIVPKLFEDKGASDYVRVWVPGCATGEEVYSLAILMREHMQSMRASPKVQIFATDIDEAALVVARTGRYPAALLDNVSPQRLKRFFSGDDVSYSINKDLRDMCIFSAHSVVRDPPFSRIDLISCRNLLIYFGMNFQSRVLPVFHFALKPRGHLFLGTSENVSQHADLFTPLDKKHRIFQRRDQITSPLQFPLFAPMGRLPGGTADAPYEGKTSAPNLRRTVESRVLERFAPPHVVINREGDILHYSPRTGKYLEPAAGLPNRQLIAMARSGLRLDLRSAIREAAETRRLVSRQNLTVEVDDRIQLVDLAIEPLGEGDHDPLYLVLFTDVGVPFVPSEGQMRSNTGDKTVEKIEQELRDTRERLQATIEEYETAVEELKSSNEELQSMNEELQSTNEELETSKEELQSVNEEMQTVNSELGAKVEEADRAHNDLRNVFDSTQIATVFLDRSFVIRSFTPAVTGIFSLISADRGRPLTDIASQLSDGIDLRRDIQTVIETDRPVERNVQRADGSAHYLMRIVPYHGYNNIVDGALITFVDVTRMVEAETHQRTLVEELNHRVRNMLTVVGAIATQTLSTSASPEQFAKSFLGRVNSLAQSYSLVSRQQWGEVSLRDIILAELQPHLAGDRTGVRVDGPDIRFASPQALGLGLVFHELVTNAVKYGGLSVEAGRLDMTWVKERGQIVLQWRESGVRLTEKAPSRRGFGMQLIERQLGTGFRGTAAFDYTPDGLHVRLVIPHEAGSPAART